MFIQRYPFPKLLAVYDLSSDFSLQLLSVKYYQYAGIGHQDNNYTLLVAEVVLCPWVTSCLKFSEIINLKL